MLSEAEEFSARVFAQYCSVFGTVEDPEFAVPYKQQCQHMGKVYKVSFFFGYRGNDEEGYEFLLEGGDWMIEIILKPNIPKFEMKDIHGTRRYAGFHYTEYPMYNWAQDEIAYHRKAAGCRFNEDDQYSGLTGSIVYGIWLLNYGEWVGANIAGNEESFHRDLAVLKMDGILDFDLNHVR